MVRVFSALLGGGMVCIWPLVTTKGAGGYGRWPCQLGRNKIERGDLVLASKSAISYDENDSQVSPFGFPWAYLLFCVLPLG